jgi:hypothetical protein
MLSLLLEYLYLKNYFKMGIGRKATSNTTAKSTKWGLFGGLYNDVKVPIIDMFYI